MRLRSSQFVFLVLLICSVQVREEYAWHVREGAASSSTTASVQHREGVAKSARQLTRLYVQLERLSPSISLDAAAYEASRTPWSMQPSARSSAALVSFTSFRRV